MLKITLGILLLLLFLAVLYSYRASRQLRQRPATAAAFGSVSALRADLWAGLCLLVASTAIVIASWLHFSFALADLTQDSSPPALFFLLDCSASMLADGIAASRLDEARSLITGIAERHPHLPCGLVTFAGNAMLDFPPSPGGGGFAAALSAAAPDLGFIPGSSPGSAIRLAQATADAANLRAVLILLSDGEVNVADLAAEHSLWATRTEPLLMIVVGELEQEHSIPWQGAWLIDPDTGLEAKSKATASQLTALADFSPAPWQMLANPKLTMATHYLQNLLKMEKKITEATKPLQFSKVAIITALLLLGMWILIKQGFLHKNTAKNLSSTIIMCLLLLGMTSAKTKTATAHEADNLEKEIIQQLQNPALTNPARARLLTNWAALLIKDATAEQELQTANNKAQEAVALCREALRLVPEMEAAKINLTAARQVLQTLTTMPTEQMEITSGQSTNKDNTTATEEQELAKTMPITPQTKNGGQPQLGQATTAIEEAATVSEMQETAGNFASDGSDTWRQMQKRRQVIPGRGAGVKPW